MVSVSLRLNIVKRRREVYIHICIDDTDGVVLVLGSDLQYVNLELIIKDLDANGIALMQTCEVSELILKDGFGIFHIDELGLMRLQFDHMPDLAVFLSHITHQRHSCRRARLRKLEHFEHPVRNVAQSLLCNKL